MNQHFALTSAPLPLQFPDLGPDVTFWLRPMAQADYDTVGYELFRHNIMPMSQESFRAHFIEQIFVTYGDDQGEEFANMMDAHWQGQDIYNGQLQLWQAQEDQRLLDMANGAPRRPQAPLPEHPQSIRERAKASAFQDDFRRACRRLRDLTIEMQTYAVRQREGMARVVIEKWEGLQAPFSKPDGIVTDESWTALRAEIGKEAIAKLCEMVLVFGTVTEEEKGNSDSPSESGSDPTGSPVPSDASDNSAGTSTESSTSPVQIDASEEITSTLSTSTSSSNGEIAVEAPAPIPTDVL